MDQNARKGSPGNSLAPRGAGAFLDGADDEWGECPHEPLRIPKFQPAEAVGTTDGNELSLAFLSTAGTRYQIFTSTAVPAANWEPVGDPVPGSGSVITARLPIGPEPSRVFVIRTAP